MANTGTASRSALTRSAAVDTSEKVRGTASLRDGGWVSVQGVVLVARAGRNSPSCQRARVQHRSASRFRYGTTWLPGSSQPTVVAVTDSRSARRTIVRARSSAAATRFSPGSANSVGGSKRAVMSSMTRLERGDHLRGDERGAGRQLVAVVRRGRQLRADDEELTLQPDEQLVELAAGLALGPRETQRGNRFVGRAVGRGARRVLRDPAAVQQPGAAVVALARVDLHLRRSLRPEPRDSTSGVPSPPGPARP